MAMNASDTVLEMNGVLDLGGLEAATDSEFYVWAVQLHALRIPKYNAKSILLPAMSVRGLKPSEDMIRLFRQWIW